MQTYREYAASLGLAIAGARGRLSSAAKEAIAKAEAEGMIFKETQRKNTAKAMAPDVSTQDSKPTQKTTQDFFGPTPEPFYPNAFHAWVDGKKIAVSGRVACGNCKCSLMYHHCANPVALAKGSPDLVEVFYG